MCSWQLPGEHKSGLAEGGRQEPHTLRPRLTFRGPSDSWAPGRPAQPALVTRRAQGHTMGDSP